MASALEISAVEEQAAHQYSESQERNPEHKRQVAVAKATIERERQSLGLQRERILSERTASPYRRAALAAALVDVESRLLNLA